MSSADMQVWSNSTGSNQFTAPESFLITFSKNEATMPMSCDTDMLMHEWLHRVRLYRLSSRHRCTSSGSAASDACNVMQAMSNSFEVEQVFPTACCTLRDVGGCYLKLTDATPNSSKESSTCGAGLTLSMRLRCATPIA